MANKKILGALAAATLAFSCAPDSQDIRTMQYFPEGRDIVCLNGNRRYTRPLYGTHTRFRLETSDRPVFAVYDKTNSYNFAFSLLLDGAETALDSSAYCKASYQGGRRVYTLKDPCWGKDAYLQVYAMASFSEEGAIWRFIPSGFKAEKLEISALRRHIVGDTFYRDGDLGTDSRSIFEADVNDPQAESLVWSPKDTSYLVYHHLKGMEVLEAEQGRLLFEEQEQARRELTSAIEINTPDPFLNTIGANLCAAADGIWDGSTVLHGANGWRTTYAGWRGAYCNDVLGWNDRAVSHFRAYAASMVTDRPAVLEGAQMDPEFNYARAIKQWGTPVYSNGYICRKPWDTSQISHYDMNLNYFDELMRHFCYDADTLLMKELWPKIKLHHEWEKRNFDPDGDHLYDAYCCIWASDALYYSGGAVTHSSAYNYYSNKMTARIASLLGEDPAPYEKEAEAILKALNERLWVQDEGHWAEYQDYMGLKRVHNSAAIWSIYTPMDCEVNTPEQAWLSTRYVDNCIPHIPVKYDYDTKALKALGLKLPKVEKDLFTVSTTNWLPYVWSTNNVAHDEVGNMALAYLLAGRSDSGYKLLKADILDQMYLGECPGNFGQISYYDKSRSEAYRDFADNVGVASRAMVVGLFGIRPDAMNSRCVISPSFPGEWDQAGIKTPYLSYTFRREGNFDIYEIEQNFSAPLQISVRTTTAQGAQMLTEGSTEKVQTIRVDRRLLPKGEEMKDVYIPRDLSSDKEYMEAMGLSEPGRSSVYEMVDISSHFNSRADDIFRNSYLSPRPEFTCLQLPRQGVGDWCTPLETPEIDATPLKKLCRNGVYKSNLGVSFLIPSEGNDIVYTSLWDNYPDSVTIPLEGSARYLCLLMAGSTQNMQSRIDNAEIIVRYSDGSSSRLPLVNPINWCPIQQDYYTDRYAFRTTDLKPYRLIFSSGELTRNPQVEFLAQAENDSPGLDVIKNTDRGIPGGAAQMLRMPLDPGKSIESLELRTLSNDVVVGIMAITLEK